MHPSPPVRQRKAARPHGSGLAGVPRQHDVPHATSPGRVFVGEANPPSATASCGGRANRAMCRSSAGGRGYSVTRPG